MILYCVGCAIPDGECTVNILVSMQFGEFITSCWQTLSFIWRTYDRNHRQRGPNTVNYYKSKDERQQGTNWKYQRIWLVFTFCTLNVLEGHTFDNMTKDTFVLYLLACLRTSSMEPGPSTLHFYMERH